jgi:hypothetical protein
MPREQGGRDSDLAAQRRELRRSVDEQAHARGEEAAQAVLRLVDRELDRSKGFGAWLSEHDCDELHICALRGFLEGLRDDLVDTVGMDDAVTQRLAMDVFGLQQSLAADAAPLPPGQQAIEDAYDALLALGLDPAEPSDELATHLGDYIVHVIAAAARHDRGEELRVEGRLLRNALVRVLSRMVELPDIGLACAHAALAEAKAAFERRLVDAERISSEESARVIELAIRASRRRQPRES